LDPDRPSTKNLTEVLNYYAGPDRVKTLNAYREIVSKICVQLGLDKTTTFYGIIEGKALFFFAKKDKELFLWSVSYNSYELSLIDLGKYKQESVNLYNAKLKSCYGPESEDA